MQKGSREGLFRVEAFGCCVQAYGRRFKVFGFRASDVSFSLHQIFHG